jgi:hypothetical protein
MVRSVFMLMRALQPTPVALARSRRSRVFMDGRLLGLPNSLVRFGCWALLRIETRITQSNAYKKPAVCHTAVSRPWFIAGIGPVYRAGHGSIH